MNFKGHHQNRFRERTAATVTNIQKIPPDVDMSCEKDNPLEAADALTRYELLAFPQIGWWTDSRGTRK